MADIINSNTRYITPVDFGTGNWCQEHQKEIKLEYNCGFDQLNECGDIARWSQMIHSRISWTGRKRDTSRNMLKKRLENVRIINSFIILMIHLNFI